MSALREAFTGAECSNVRTWIQSGNVLFDVPDKRARQIMRTIPSHLAPLTGGTPPTVIFRARDEVVRIAEHHPFGTRVDNADLKLYVVFLAGRPRTTPDWPLRSEKENLDVIGMDGLDVFVVSGRKSGGLYGFPNPFIEKQLGVDATSRNLTTVRKIATLID